MSDRIVSSPENNIARDDYYFDNLFFSDPGALVETTLQDAKTLVDTYDVVSTQALNDLADLDFSIEGNAVTGAAILDLVVPDSDAVAPTSPGAGDFTIDGAEVVSNYNTFLATLDLNALSVASVVVPELGASAPIFSAPSVPDDTLPDIPTDLPVTVDPVVPDSPTIEFPDAPVLSDVELPEVPEIESLSFDAILPTLELTAPDAAFSWDTEEYSSNIADDVRAKLHTDITEGGTGLDADVEAAIFDRANDRLEYQLSSDYNAELSNFETWGFDLPDGILAANLREVLGEGTRRVAELNRDILVKQAELAQENTHFALTSGLTHENQLMDFFIKQVDFAFRAAKATWDAALELFRGKVDEFNARMAGYKVQGDVFEARVRSGNLLIDRYRVQMEGAKIAGELNALEVDIYTTRIGALRTVVELWAAQVDGARLHAELNKARIDGFIAVLAAKKAQIDAVTAKFSLYQSQMDGEKTRADIYATQVQAHETLVSSKKVEADINQTQLQSDIQANENKIRVLSEAIIGYKTELDGAIGEAGVGAQLFAAEVQKFIGEINQDNATVAAQAEIFKAKATQADANARISARNVEANLRVAAMLTQTQAAAATAVANISAQKVASALSILNVSASMSESTSASESTSIQNSYSLAESNSDSTSESKDRNDNIQRSGSV